MVMFVVAGICNYLIYLQTGRMPLREWMNSMQQMDGSWFKGAVQSVSPDQLAAKARQLSDQVGDKLDSSAGAAVKVYKWTDAEGVVHYGQQAGVAEAEELSVNPNQSVMSAPEPYVAPSTTPAANSASANPQGSPLEQARAAAEAMRIHNEQQQGL